MKSNHLCIIIGICLLCLSVSAFEVQTTATATTLNFTFTDPEAIESVWFNNEEIKTPIVSNLVITGLEPDTEYILVTGLNQTTYPNQQRSTLAKTLPTEQLQIEDVVLEYGYILITLLVLLGIYTVKLPFGGFIPLFMSLIGVIHYVKYEGVDKLILISYLILMIISAYTIYSTGEKQ